MTDTERITLRRAGFTEREINTMRVKFENLLRINPCLTSDITGEVSDECPEIERLREELTTRDRKRDAALLRMTLFNKALRTTSIADLADRRESGEWEPEFEIR